MILKMVSIENPYYEFKIISHRFQYIFYEIPKCASSSIKKLIFLQNAGHPLSSRHDYWIERAPEMRLLGSVPESEYKDYFKFAIVRNPWDRVVSCYHNKRHNLKPFFPEGQSDISFKEFLNLIKSKQNHHWIPCSNFIPKVDGKLFVDKILRFEMLGDGFEELKEIVGLEGSLPVINTSVRSEFRDYYDDEAEAIVRDLFKEDIETFDYQF
jgi:hypothetical protein